MRAKATIARRIACSANRVAYIVLMPLRSHFKQLYHTLNITNKRVEKANKKKRWKNINISHSFAQSRSPAAPRELSIVITTSAATRWKAAGWVAERKKWHCKLLKAVSFPRALWCTNAFKKKHTYIQQKPFSTQFSSRSLAEVAIKLVAVAVCSMAPHTHTHRGTKILKFINLISLAWLYRKRCCGGRWKRGAKAGNSASKCFTRR